MTDIAQIQGQKYDPILRQLSQFYEKNKFSTPNVH